MTIPHDVDTVGAYIEEGIDLLNGMGFDTRWEEILRKTNISRARHSDAENG